MFVTSILAFLSMSFLTAVGSPFSAARYKGVRSRKKI
jgi:hypothetical protein